MKIATYNQMFGLNGSSSLRSLHAHYTAYIRGNVEKIERKSDIMRTIHVVDQIDADILGICEVISKKQEEDLKRELRKRGYRYFSVGNGRRTRRKNWLLIGLLASKEEFKMESLGSGEDLGFFQEEAEILHVYFPKNDCDLLYLHLLIPRKRKSSQRMRDFTLQKIIELIQKDMNGKRLIIMGDFNMRYKKLIKKYPFFKKFENLSESLKTWSPKIFSSKFPSFDLDHILGRGFSLKENGLIHGESDHALVWAEVNYE